MNVTRRAAIGSLFAAGTAIAISPHSNKTVWADEVLIMPTPETLEKLASHDDDGPVVILNLVKYNADPGAAGYARYSRAAGPILRKHGANVPFSAQCEQPLAGNEEWDAMALLEFPTRKAFADMLTDPEYQVIAHQREESLERAILYVFTKNG